MRVSILHLIDESVSPLQERAPSSGAPLLLCVHWVDAMRPAFLLLAVVVLCHSAGAVRLVGVIDPTANVDTVVYVGKFCFTSGSGPSRWGC